MSRYCSHCGAEVKEGARFCERCGQAITPSDIPFSVAADRKSSKKWVIVVVALALLGACCLLLVAAGLMAPSVLRSMDVNLPWLETGAIETPDVLVPTPLVEPSPTIFAPTLSLPVQPTVLPAQPTAEPKRLSFNFENVQFEYDPALAAGFSGEVVQAETSQEGFPGSTYPRHVRVDVSGYVDQKAFTEPFILVYPLAEYIKVEPQVIETANTLDGLLKTRETELDSMPFLPYWNAGQVFNSNIQYLDFQNGSGVRYLTQYAQDVSPINNEYLFYTFQGLTSDHKYYIAAVLPVNNSMLPDTYNLSAEEYQKFSENYLPYLAEVKKLLTDQPNNSFEPDLGLLDALFESVSVK